MGLRVLNISKSYGEHPVLAGFSKVFENEKIYGLMAPSGYGKTTLLRMIAGLETPDDGRIEKEGIQKITMVFQENRLCDFLDPIENIRIVTPKNVLDAEIIEILQAILPKEALHQKVKEFSGGMKRRVAVARSLLAPSDMILMDEPFTGLDEVTKSKVIDFIKAYQKGRIIVISSHQPEDFKALDAVVVEMEK